MNRGILIGSVIVILFVIISGVVMILKKDGEIVIAKDQYADLNEVQFRTIDGEFTVIETNTHSDVLLVFFNSTCDYCHEKARIFKRKKEEFRNTRIFWISSEPSNYIQNFINEFDFEDQHVTFLEDREGYSYTHFNIISTPTILHYDSSGLSSKSFLMMLR